MICKSMVQACLSSIAVFTCASVALASPNGKPHIALNLGASVVSYDAKGVEHDSPADVALKSGALIRYTVLAKNVGDAPARNLSPSARVPAGTVYEPTPSVHVSSATVEFSLDGGKTWSAVPTVFRRHRSRHRAQEGRSRDVHRRAVGRAQAAGAEVVAELQLRGARQVNRTTIAHVALTGAFFRIDARDAATRDLARGRHGLGHRHQQSGHGDLHRCQQHVVHDALECR